MVPLILSRRKKIIHRQEALQSHHWRNIQVALLFAYRATMARNANKILGQLCPHQSSQRQNINDCRDFSHHLEIREMAHNPCQRRTYPSTVFSFGPKQNEGSLLTPVFDTVFYVLSHGTLGFALHGSSFNHFLIGNYSTANQIL